MKDDQEKSREELYAELVQLRRRVGEERQLSRRSLEESEERFRRLAESARDMIFRVSLPDELYAYVSPASEALTGFSPDEFYLAPQLLHDIVHSEDREEWERYWSMVLGGEEAPGHEYRIIHKNGGIRWIYQHSVIILDERGDPLALEGMITDITGRRAAEKERDRMFNFSLDMMCVANFEGYFLQVNPAWTATLGWSAEELKSRPWLEFIHPEDWEQTLQVTADLREGKKVYHFENRYRCHDGSYRWLSWNSFPLEEEEKIFAVTRDVTENKVAEAVLREQGQLLEQAQQIANTGHFHFDLKTRQMKWSRQLYRIYGLEGEGPPPMGEEHKKRMVEGEWERVAEAMTRSFHQHSPYEIEYRIIREDGEIRTLHAIAYWEVDEDSEPDVFLGTVQDITEQKKVEEALLYRMEYERLLSTISTRLINLSPEEAYGEIQGALGEVGEFLGVERGGVLLFNGEMTTLEEVIEWVCEGEKPMGHLLRGMSLHDVPLWLEKVRCGETRLLAQAEAIPDMEEKGAELLAASGMRSLVETPLLRSGRVLGEMIFASREEGKRWPGDVVTFLKLIGEILANVLERREIEQALRSSEELFRRYFEQGLIGMAVTSPRKGWVHVNDRLCKMVGYTPEELKERDWFSLSHPDDLPVDLKLFEQIFQGGRDEFSMEKRFLHRDGSTVYTRLFVKAIRHATGNVQYFLTHIEDITERKQLEQQLIRAQKMEAVGALAGGIAHDFNNILGAIVGYTELVQYRLPPDSLEWTNLSQVLKATARARDLIRQILAISRQDQQEERPIYLGPVVKEALKMLRASLPSTIEIKQFIATESGTVTADPTQIHQVLMNLCTNASHAMQDEGGVLRVELKEVEQSEELRARYPTLTLGMYKRLSVHDTGHGIAPELQEKIFDPYFTTKEKEVGTGLGLAVVHGVVKRYGGEIFVQSEPGKGTSFDVFFPRSERKVSLEATTCDEWPVGQARVLFVDDESVLVDVGCQMLEELGCKVQGVTEPLAALKIFREHPEQFDLVITDQTMPRLTGDRLAQQLLQIRPDIPIVLCTGYSEALAEENLEELGVREIMMKPLVMKKFAQTLRRLFES